MQNRVTDAIHILLNPVSMFGLVVFILSGAGWLYHFVGMFNHRTRYVGETFSFGDWWKLPQKTEGLTEQGAWHREWAQRSGLAMMLGALCWILGIWRTIAA